MGAMKKAVQLLKQGKALLIFPEGTRSQTGEIQDAQPGIGYLSVLSGAPILPAYVKGTDIAMPKGSRSIKLTRVSVYFGNLIEPEKLKLASDRKEACQQLADYVVGEIKRLGDSVN